MDSMLHAPTTIRPCQAGVLTHAKGLAMPGQSPRMRSLTLAGATPAAEPDQHSLQLLDELAAQVEQMRRALIVATDEFQVSEPLVFGGTTGSYSLPSEFSTPAQYRVVCCAFGGAGTATLSSDQGLTTPAVTGVIQPSARQQGIVFAASAASTVSARSEWADLPPSASLFLNVAVTTDSAWVTVQFRRRVNRAGIYSEGHA